MFFKSIVCHGSGRIETEGQKVDNHLINKMLIDDEDEIPNHSEWSE